jgi:hypothetical protein
MKPRIEDIRHEPMEKKKSGGTGTGICQTSTFPHGSIELDDYRTGPTVSLDT